MAKKVSRRKAFGQGEFESLKLPVGLQMATLGMLAVAWLGTAVITLASTHLSSGGFSWVYIGLTIALPIVFFLTALLYAWRRYVPLHQKLFVSAVLATSGYAAAQVLISFLFMLNNRFGLITTDNTASNSAIYALEWLAMLLSYAAFVVVIGLLPHHKKAEA